MLSRALLFARTVAHFRRDQLWSMVQHRVLRGRQTTKPVGQLEFRTLATRTAWLALPAPGVFGHEFVFLNQRRSFLLPSIDWRASAEPKLWRYNLHYFDYLHWPGLDGAAKRGLIDSWIAGNPLGSEDAWEPYPLSLRLVNWIKFIGSEGQCFDLPEHWLDSLALQLAWQSGNVEDHLLANHLLVNGKALVFGGLFLDGDQASRCLKQGMGIMVAEADEQFLGDGGHFERSFQYHCLVLCDYLDVLNVVLANPEFVDVDDLARLQASAERGLRFLRHTLHADDRIPLFNDSAFGIAPEPLELIDYGERVLGLDVDVPAKPHRIAAPDTGYYGYRNEGDSFLIDCGAVGPNYQPGHAHCDNLSYELCVDGRRVVVDSGVYEYEPGEMRHYVRSTAAHNTVRVDRAEQSEIWAAFRVARRAYPVDPVLSDIEDGLLFFEGRHTGYRRLRGKVDHRRRVRMELVGRWSVTDTVSGRGSHRVESFIHLHPDVEVAVTGDREYSLTLGGTQLRLRIESPVTLRQESGWYCPEFGIRHPNTVVVLEAEGHLPIEIRYIIERA